MKRPSTSVVILYIAIVASVAAVVGVVSTYQTAQNNEDRIKDIEQVNYETCVARNELRTILRTQIQREISQSIAFEQSGQYARFFPNIPSDELHDLLEEQRDDLRSDKARLAPEECVVP